MRDSLASLKTITNNASVERICSNSRRPSLKGGMRGATGASVAAEPLVETVIVKLALAPLVTWTLGAEQVAFAGAPLQAKLSVPVKPLPGVACKLN